MEDFDDDDDFGDLYGDVEVQASSAMNVVQGLSQLPPENDDIHDNAIEDCDDGFSEEPSNVDDVNVDNATGEGEEEEEEEEESSESEDDLNIVLNDDDDDDVEINTNINNVNSNNFNNGLGFDREANEEGNERYSNRMEHASGGGAGGERGKGVVGGYNSQYKNMRFHTPAFPSNLKGSGSAGVASYSSTSVRGDREDSVYVQRTGSSSLAFQNGHNFSLPRSRTILDVNIDTFERKPWRHPGADITDFFNFGFDEDSWKDYCNHLDKYHGQTVKASRMFTSKSPGHNTADNQFIECEVGYVNEEFANEAVAKKVAYSMQQHSKLISGKAIQVENCIFERQPSTDIWRPLDRDSDVVIQIAVQDFKEDCLTSAKEGVDGTDTFTHEASEIETDGVDEARDILCSSSAIEDELPSLEGHGDGSGNSVPERPCRRTPASGPVSTDSDNNGSVQISDSDEHHEQDWTDLDGTAEAMEAFDDTGGMTERKISNTEPSVVEPESSNGGQSPESPTSPSSRSRLERPRYGAYADLRESLQKSKVASPSSKSELRESVTYDYHPSRDSKSYGVKTKPSDPKFHARRRSPMWDDLKYERRRHTHMSELKSHMDDEDASYLSDAEGSHYTRHSTVNHQKQMNGQHGCDSYGAQYNSYYGGSESLFDYGDLKPSNSSYRDAYTKRQNWKGHSSFGYEMDQRHGRNINENQCYFERRVSRVRHEEARQDFYHHERRRPVQDMESVTHEESRQWTSKYDRYLDNEEGTLWKTKAEDWQFSKRVKNDNFLLESHYENDLMREKCREPVLYVDNDRAFHQHKNDKRLSHNRREVESPGRSRRRCDSPFNGVRNKWGADDKDEKGRCTRRRSLSFGSFKRPCFVSRQRWQGAVSPKSGVYRSHGRNWRNTGAERSNNNDRLHNFDNAFDSNENITNLGDQDHFVRRRHHEQSEISHWNVEQYNSTHWDNKVYAEGASYPFERVSGPRRFDAHHGSDHVGRLIDSRQVSWGRLKLTRGRHRDSQCRQNSNFIRGDTFPRCRDSVDSHLVGVDRKCILQSTGRSFEAGNMYYDRYEYMDCDSDLKRKTFEHSRQTYPENETRAETLKVDTKQKGQNRHDKFSDVQHNDSQDIEEGQIITQEVNEKTMEKMSSSEEMRQIGEKKNPINENAVAFEGHENPRVLEIIAKMEKRRERFKQPITVTKDAEKTSQTLVDTVVETSDSKPQRPARKRKWDGS